MCWEVQSGLPSSQSAKAEGQDCCLFILGVDILFLHKSCPVSAGALGWASHKSRLWQARPRHCFARAMKLQAPSGV